MKKKLYILFFIGGLLSISSCTEELELENPNKLTDGSFWKTSDDLESGVATIYNALVDNNNAGYWEIQAMQLKENRTENFIARNDVPGRYAVSTYKNSPSTAETTAIFKTLYIGIFRANQVIHYASQIKNIDETKRAQLVAEATFLRGLNYFNLVIEYGSVPIFTDIVTNQEDYFKAKATEEEVWNQVISDFDAAAKSPLPEIYPAASKGRVTKNTAIAYLGKTYLYRKEWAKAEEQFNKLVNNEATNGYGLLEDYAQLFDGKHENSKESVFEIQFSKVGGATIWGGEPSQRTRATTMAQECAPGEVGGWFELLPTKTLLDAMLQEKTAANDFDPRATATLAWNYPGCIYYTYPFASKFKADAIWIRKNQNWWDADEGEWKSELNEFAMRYADVLLMLAEAKTMQGNSDGAAPLVKRIRDRAKLADITMTGWSQDQMMTEIMHQRNVEFAREGLHFYDLRRWGTLETVIKGSLREGYANYSAKYNYYPIPSSELNNNPKMTQNAPW
ncbi:RagB/SusD family nutrient uptake outer membrane protein [Flavobacterium sp. MC2016-06]|uniref:RagB/SusD family nutrient uptake outer membrane protein n=1 Tax=Flavobacterium sp. MC2016-06 TaxID=2676308 RepID=UPI0012BAAA90|nr:RagB/SusD family nutrient uptake outer membrane protein [Flavobacterium sp. MC2016-06]MBU3858878.1 RagB/SusD family nutrient uptake outer membrane protein [Flavobacterium sp. MC2016-06]